MSKLFAFVGHSFSEGDKFVIREFTDFFNTLKGSGIDFEWENALPAEPKELSIKVKEKMKNKNVFIGICTGREKVIEATKLKSTIFLSRYLFGLQTDFFWKTSDWILQEISFAYAKDMNIIIILEDGVRKPEGLHGNIEYIPFSRDRISNSFLKIIEMLKSINPIRSTSLDVNMDQNVEGESDVPDSEAIAFNTKSISIDDGWSKKDYEDSLIQCILYDDKEKEQELFDKYLISKVCTDETDKIVLETKRHFFKYALKGVECLEQLRSLEVKFPNIWQIKFYLGRIFEKYKEFRIAGEYFLNAAASCSIVAEKTRLFCNASNAFAKAGDIEKESNSIRNAFGNFELDASQKEEILNTLIKNTELHEDKYSMRCYLEGLLNNNPSLHDQRFKLALNYNDAQLSLYHYNILLDSKPDTWVYNNIGVSEDNLKLNVKAVSHYKEAAKLNNSLAMSNLARKYIREGFLSEAEELCANAVKIENYDQQIGRTIDYIREVKEQEENDRAGFLKSAEIKRTFFVDYNFYLFTKLESQISNLWLTKNGSVKVTLNKGTFIASINVEHPLSLLYTLTNSPSKKRISKILYEGKIFGSSVRYKKTENIHSVDDNYLEKTNSFEGFLYILNNEEIKLMEYDIEGNVNYENWISQKEQKLVN